MEIACPEIEKSSFTSYLLLKLQTSINVKQNGTGYDRRNPASEFIILETVMKFSHVKLYIQQHCVILLSFLKNS